MKLPQLSIATKLYAIFALLATVTVGLALVAAINVYRHAAFADEFEAAYSGGVNVERVNALIYAVVMESRGIYMTSDPATAKVYADGLLNFNARIAEVMKEWRQRVTPEDAALFEAFAARIREFQDFRRELVRRATELGPAAARGYGDQEANRAVRKALNKDIENLAAVYANRSRQVYSKIEQELARPVWLLALLAVAAVLLASAGAIIIWGAVVRPLARITGVTTAVAGGRSQVTVPYGERSDEIGALARSIAVFRETMRCNEELNQAAVEDARVRARQQEGMAQEIIRFGADMEATLAELGRISALMLAASTQVAGAADKAAIRTTGAATASADASANVRDIAAAADQLAASVLEIDRQVTQSNAIAAKAMSDAEQTNATVKELDEAAGRIGDVVRLITDIAEQTNLLALNATIEAARAGDAGRGFAVVASEVKALAGQTAKATENIGAQITGMQQATARSIRAIGAIEQIIRDIGQISAAIAAAVTEQGAATQEIARSVETAARRTLETASEVERVGEATSATRHSATAVESVADDLGRVASHIRSQVDAFFMKLRAA